MNINREEIFDAIVKERERQDQLHPIQLLKSEKTTDASILKNYFFGTEMLAILVEEVGEVGSALQGDGVLEDELIQVASVCVRWLENNKSI